MNITLICPFYYPNLLGGAEVNAKILAEWLARNGFNVQVISFDGNSDSEKINNVKVTRYPVISAKGLSLTLMYPVFRAMQKFEDKTDLYHVHDVYPMMGAGLYRIFNGKRPVVATLENYAGFCPVSTALCSSCYKLQSRMTCLFEQTSLTEKPLALAYAIIYPLLTSLAKKLDKYIAVSNNVAELYTKYNFNTNKIVHIPIYVNIVSSKFERQKINNNFNIIYIGTISEHKGVDILIRAFKMIEDEIPNAHLIIIGKGKWDAYCRSLVKKLQLENRVTFVGHVQYNELEKLYVNADVLVHPARWNEPFGRIIIEAFCYDVPCIVSDKVSPEIIGDAGLVFNHDDVQDLARQLIIFANDKDLQAKLRRNCREVRKRYDMELICRMITDIYYELINHK
jgi:glycosyltransferase involved in cell wall biosynthesis